MSKWSVSTKLSWRKTGNWHIRTSKFLRERSYRVRKPPKSSSSSEKRFLQKDRSVWFRGRIQLDTGLINNLKRKYMRMAMF